MIFVFQTFRLRFSAFMRTISNIRSFAFKSSVRILSWYSKRSFRYHAVHVADTVLSRCIVA